MAAASMPLLGMAPAKAVETIPVIVKDTTAQYWQIVMAGARKAGKDLGVNVPTMGAQSEADIPGPRLEQAEAYAGEFVQKLPWPLTGGQQRALHQILRPQVSLAWPGLDLDQMLGGVQAMEFQL